MMADDIAHNPLNPHPGKIFNQPGGSDVYEGVPKVLAPCLLCLSAKCAWLILMTSVPNNTRCCEGLHWVQCQRPKLHIGFDRRQGDWPYSQPWQVPDRLAQV